MKLNKYIISFLVGSLAIITSCSDFLDTAPDNRVELKTPLQVSKLLIGGYLDGNYSLVCELSGDNIVDNQAPDDEGIRYNLSSYERMDDEIFAWEPVKSSNSSDSPTSIWRSCYYAIAVANHALEAIDRMEKDENMSSEDRVILSAAKGEALMIRAYHHFILANVFCQAYRDDDLSSDSIKSPGIPYMKKPETSVLVHYNRGSVTNVYKNIEADLTAGLDLINDGAYYEKPKYHFNKLASYAFAARFYLFKREYDKVIEYASLVLGSNPASVMRNWKEFDGLASSEAISLEWVDETNANNLMLLPTYSGFARHIGGPYRYTCNREAAASTIYGFGPGWNIAPHPCWSASGLYVSGGQDYGLFSGKVMELFEYTNKLANTGYAHIVRCEFTTEETLLCRAEAYIYKNEFDAAFQDLKTWNDSRADLPGTPVGLKEFDEENMKSFYRKDKNFVKQYNTEKMSPKFVITDAQKVYIDCLMHFRRLENLFDGTRWFDIKRYGLEIEHRIGKDRVEKLTWDDPRRAIQIPQEVIAAGLEANPTLTTPSTITLESYKIK